VVCTQKKTTMSGTPPTGNSPTPPAVRKQSFANGILGGSGRAGGGSFSGQAARRQSCVNKRRATKLAN